MILINGKPDTQITVSDRGLQYGDGLFETIAFRNNKLEWLNEHLARLEQGCHRLQIPFDEKLLRHEIALLCAHANHDHVIKLILTRGHGGRGYRPPSLAQPQRIVSLHPFPDQQLKSMHGVTVRLCKTRLAQNPALAGIKHLNRLEQVLARSEWNDTHIDEGLMLDTQGNLIEGTMSNLFLVKDNVLYTPDLGQCGIDGIIRQKVLSLTNQNAIKQSIQTLKLTDLHHADEIFLTNSVIGIWPVTALDNSNYQWQVGPITKFLQQSLAQHKHV